MQETRAPLSSPSFAADMVPLDGDAAADAVVAAGVAAARRQMPGGRPFVWLCEGSPEEWREAAARAGLGMPLRVPRDWAAVAGRAESLGGGCALLLDGGTTPPRCWLLRSRPPEDRTAAEEICLDGVRYADVPHEGDIWHLGSTDPLWRQHLPLLGRTPSPEALQALAERGVWLAPSSATSRLAVMCCGQGSVWPGMGRELYDGFPAARAAMDRIAAVADWDVLSLMDESDVEKIGLTRWQQPYLFLLEYAQWSVFASLGLQPSLMCGHSLGELMALCFAGVYAPEVAWYILDTRATHMAELEARATRDTGMMAVHAGADVIEEARRTWPSLYVSNYNTPRQFIVSGPRDMLLEARKSLRKRRIPAIMLNVTLAFHHPSMRVLRDLSLRRLNALEMQAPRMPLLSCITTGFYPAEQSRICEYIADLDENSVRWVECVQQMRSRDGITHFLELGPQDTMCGLTLDCDPEAVCIPAARKGRELESMRQACARLYALGHLPRAAIYGAAAARGGESEESSGAPVPASPAATPAPDLGPHGRMVLELLAEASGRPVASLRPDMDLRYDLALRSSRFPLIIQQAEERLGQKVDFDALMQAATVGDLARVLSGLPPVGGVPHQPENRAAGKRVREPLLRYAPEHLLEEAAALPSDPCGAGLELRPGQTLALLSAGPLDEADAARALDAAAGLAPFGPRLILPSSLAGAASSLRRLGAEVLLSDDAASAASDAVAARRLSTAAGAPDGILMVATRADMTELPGLEELLPSASYVCLLRHVLSRGDAADDAPVERCLAAQAARLGVPFRLLRLWDDGIPPAPRELGDLLSRELACGGRERICWARAATASPASSPAPFVADRPERFPLVFCRADGREAARAGLLHGQCHFSRFADPMLAGHGDAGSGTPWLPLSRALQALLEAGSLFLPWLSPIGLSDVRFAAPPLLPPGVTREAAFDVRAGQWLRHDGAMARVCPATLSVRAISANGRRGNQSSPVAHAVLLMGAGGGTLPPLWPTETAAGNDDALPAAFYRQRGYGGDWRLLEAFSVVDDTTCDARMSEAASRLAVSGGVGYTGRVVMFEALAQAAAVSLGLLPGGARKNDATPLPGDIASPCGLWRLGAVGFLRFAAPAAARGPVTLRVRRCWMDERLVRYDAQAADADGVVLATVNHLQFDAVAALQAAATA
ncbi:MAG: acyltransferase domain-containing protein [Desulfovibrio sp.]|uniref:acyltransferase domain-containing protein n=1 Tax=Desulfovibrio sp. TaxID=885 RepID=UPI0025BC255A|nr:acyltransferase domain-containing protein [Desulfovibrio sp.]MCI7569478.1 acyltransferase domain-containing protein [Desulfovibrio sp.]